MSSGKTHEKINILFFMVIAYVGVAGSLFPFYGWTGLLYAAVLTFGYWVGTYYMNPDLDIRSRPYNRWKWIRFIWIPYQKLGHRSIWTHGVLIGDVIRYAYLLGILAVVYGIMGSLLGTDMGAKWHWVMTTAWDYKTYVLAFFLGNCLSSLAHIIADHSSTGMKRFLRR